MIRRNITENLTAAMTDTPVVLLNGARQTGKSTLAKWCMESVPKGRYLTLDDATVLSAAVSDPNGFVSELDCPVVLDEIQQAPELFPAIKMVVDQNRQPGRFLLTGSADVMLLPNLSESLAGRMEILTLWPFATSELTNSEGTFVDSLFSTGRFSPPQPSTLRKDLIRVIITGGFPEAVARTSPNRRRAWFNSYITTILQRDVRSIANIEQLTTLPSLLKLMATRSTGLLNSSEVSRTLGLPQTTLKRYLTVLEMTFLVQFLQPWCANLGKRLVKSPKVMLCDTGLMAHLLGVETADAIPEQVLGALVENFAAMELKKQATWSKTQPNLYHFREYAGREVDILLENAAGQIVGVEVKASNTVGKHNFKHLEFLREHLGERFVRGVVLYLGDHTVSFDKTLHAVPLGVV